MMHNYIFPGQEVEAPQGFPHAPVDWTPEDTESAAKAEHLTLEIMHWQTVRALQDF
jgi:tRNA 2-thiouridine synthesizing protein E